MAAECFEDAASVCNNLAKFVKENDIVLVKGSRVAGLEIVVDRLKELSS
jgi:UDP-N-acetylmuramyl pentapeptide synthase